VKERKTDRVYGAVANAIRDVARQGRPFTISEVVHESVEGRRRALSSLVNKGELRRLKQGAGAGDKSIYQIV